MAKELPYFRFVVQEWQNGDISIESYEIKGLFIEVCGFYWLRDCTVTLAMLEKKFGNAKAMLEQLIELDILKHSEDGSVNINFLNEQFDVLSEKRKKRQEAGSKGGKAKALASKATSNATAMPQQNPSYKDKDKDKDNYNNKAFIADVNEDEGKFIEVFQNVLLKRPASVEKVLMTSKLPSLEQETKNRVWSSFIENAKINTPIITDESHAYNIWKKYMIEGKWKESLNTSNKIDYYSPSKIKNNWW